MARLAAFVIRRMLAMLVIAFIIATVVFFMAHASPYDPVRLLLGQHYTPSAAQAIRAEYGLNVPVGQQYVNFLGNLLQGNLGLSVSQSSQGVPVWTLISTKLPVSLKLAAWSLVIALLVGLPVGLVSALRQNSIVDHAGQSITILAYVIPAFVLCPLCQLIFGVYLHWLPVLGWGGGGWFGPFGLIPVGQSISQLILPVAIFAAGLAGYFAKSFR